MGFWSCQTWIRAEGRCTHRRSITASQLGPLYSIPAAPSAEGTCQHPQCVEAAGKGTPGHPAQSWPMAPVGGTP